MRSTNLSSKQNWEKGQATLYKTLKKEVTLMRELLSNLHEEELCLLEQNAKKWFHVMKERSELVMQVRAERIKRSDATIKLEKLSIELSKVEHLPADEVMTCEMVSQIDQLFALIDRTNLQNCRNDALFLQTKEKGPPPLQCPFPHPLHQPDKRRRRTTTATYPTNKG